MLRLCFPGQWHALADEALEGALYDSHALHTYTGIDLGSAAVPDATTLLNCRRLLECRLGRIIAFMIPFESKSGN